MICVYLHNNTLLTYEVDYKKVEFSYIEDNIKGKNNKEVAKEVASSRKAML